MKHSTEDILHSMIVATLNHVTYPEFVERLAMFFSELYAGHLGGRVRVF